MPSFRVGADIGGTFTDVVFLGEDDSVFVTKLASTPDDYSRAVIEGVRGAIAKLRISPSMISEVSHGFTVATNAILERKGVRTALITTAGFRDVLEMGRIRTPRPGDFAYRKPLPLVERQHRLEVAERVTARGKVLRPLVTEDVDRVVSQILDDQIESVAICLLHSYANPVHERYIEEALHRAAPDLTVSASYRVLPEMREFERTSTTVINAYVRPIVQSYLMALDRGLRELGVSVPLRIMQSNGGLADVQVACDKPIHCVESGPAAGVAGAYQLSKRLRDMKNILTIDMGGTTAKASIIEDGEMLRAPEYEVGAGLNAGNRLVKGAGYVLRVSSVEIAEVGNGGGSIAWLDRSNTLQVGPHSSGAVPGPACYGNGGSEPTVTDANVLLGLLNPQHLLGGAFPLIPDQARRQIEEKIARPLSISATEAAHGIHLLVNSNMTRAVRVVSSERGRDPRQFTLIAFGGAGPLHAAGMAELLGIPRILIPQFPGLFSGMGLLFSDVEHHFVQTYFRNVEELDVEDVNRVVAELRVQAEDLLTSEGFDRPQQALQTQVDMKYAAQAYETTVSYDMRQFDSGSLSGLVEAFEQEHERTYGYRTGGSMQVVSIRLIGRGIPHRPRLPEALRLLEAQATLRGERPVYFGPRDGWVQTPVAGRTALSDQQLAGPLIIEEYDSSTVVRPRWTASLDRFHNIVLTRAS